MLLSCTYFVYQKTSTTFILSISVKKFTDFGPFKNYITPEGGWGDKCDRAGECCHACEIFLVCKISSTVLIHITYVHLNTLDTMDELN